MGKTGLGVEPIISKFMQTISDLWKGLHIAFFVAIINLQKKKMQDIRILMASFIIH